MIAYGLLVLLILVVLREIVRDAAWVASLRALRRRDDDDRGAVDGDTEPRPHVPTGHMRRLHRGLPRGRG